MRRVCSAPTDSRPSSTPATGRPVILEYSTDPAEALEGADFCLSSAEFGRFEYWRQDYEIPRRYGATQVNGENGGPGAVFHSLRSIKNTLSICAEHREALPGRVPAEPLEPDEPGDAGDQPRAQASTTSACVTRCRSASSGSARLLRIRPGRHRRQGVGHQPLHLLHRDPPPPHAAKISCPGSRRCSRGRSSTSGRVTDRADPSRRQRRPVLAHAGRPALLPARRPHGSHLRDRSLLGRQPHRRVPPLRPRDRRASIPPHVEQFARIDQVHRTAHDVGRRHAGCRFPCSASGTVSKRSCRSSRRCGPAARADHGGQRAEPWLPAQRRRGRHRRGGRHRRRRGHPPRQRCRRSSNRSPATSRRRSSSRT